MLYMRGGALFGADRIGLFAVSFFPASDVFFFSLLSTSKILWILSFF